MTDYKYKTGKAFMELANTDMTFCCSQFECPDDRPDIYDGPCDFCHAIRDGAASIKRLTESIRQACCIINGRDLNDTQPMERRPEDEIIYQAIKGRNDYEDTVGRLEWLVELVINWADAEDGFRNSPPTAYAADYWGAVAALRKAVGR